MDRPIIVLIDAEAGTVSLYGRFNKTLSIHDTYLLRAYIEGEEVIYVESASEVSGDDVAAQTEAIAEQLEAPERERQYIRYVGEGYKRVDDIKLLFAGPKDAKQLDRVGYDIFERSPRLRQMLHDGEVEILSETEIRRIKKPLPSKGDRDKQLDSMILNRKEDAFEMDNMFKEENEVTEADSDSTEAEEIIRELKKSR